MIGIVPCRASMNCLANLTTSLPARPTERSKSVYDFAAAGASGNPCRRTSANGIPAGVLKKAEHVVSIPMLDRGLSSVNVAGWRRAIVLSLPSNAIRHLGRKRPRTSGLLPLRRGCSPGTLVLPTPVTWPPYCEVHGPLGWLTQRLVLGADRNAIWFIKDRAIVLAGPARRQDAK